MESTYDKISMYCQGKAAGREDRAAAANKATTISATSHCFCVLLADSHCGL